jgi:hypothetical protein
MTLNDKDFLERFIYVPTICDGKVGTLNTNNPIDKCILEQLQKCNASGVELCHIEDAENFPMIPTDGKVITHFIWDIPSWRQSNTRYERIKRNAELARRDRLKAASITNHIASALKIFMPAMDEKSLNNLAAQFCKDRNKPLMQGIFQMYNINIKSIEEKVDE